MGKGPLWHILAKISYSTQGMLHIVQTVFPKNLNFHEVMGDLVCVILRPECSEMLILTKTYLVHLKTTTTVAADTNCNNACSWLKV